MLSSHLNDPEHWRDRSKEARAIAEGMADSVSKQKMLDVAANYELSLSETHARIYWWCRPPKMGTANV